MAGVWPFVRRFGSNARKFAEHNPLMDEILSFGVIGTVFWSLLRIDRKHDAALAAARRNRRSNRST